MSTRRVTPAGAGAPPARRPGAQLDAGLVRELERRGHTVEKAQAMGSLQSVIRRDEKYRGYSDPRRPEAGSVGPAMLRAIE